jgi:acyl-CoA thioesterase YciA
MNADRTSSSPAPTSPELPRGEPALRTLAMPADANPSGDIFGGWVMSQMDLAGSVPAVERAGGRVATVAVDAMRFHAPVQVGDLVSCYAEVVRVGNTSIGVRVETWVTRRADATKVRVTEGTLVYVALDTDGRPRTVPPEA